MEDTQSTDSQTRNDRELLRRIVARDRSALEEFVEAWELPLLRIAYRIVGRVNDAEEVRQVVLLKIIQQLGRLRDVENIGAWLRRCVINESLLFLRQRRTHDELHPELEVKSQQATVIQNNEAELLAAALETLDPEARAMLSLRFDDGLTVREIGKVLDIPHTTIQSRLQSAIAKLRTQLGILIR